MQQVVLSGRQQWTRFIKFENNFFLNFIQILSSSPPPPPPPLHLPMAQHCLWKMRSFRPEISEISAQAEISGRRKLLRPKSPADENSSGRSLWASVLQFFCPSPSIYYSSRVNWKNFCSSSPEPFCGSISNDEGPYKYSILLLLLLLQIKLGGPSQ